MSDEETLKALKEENKQIKLLYRVSNLIHQSLDPKTALNVILQQAIELTHAHSASVSLINPTSGLLELEAAVGLPDEAYADFNLPINRGITGWVAKKGKSALINDVQKDLRYVSIWAEVQSELAVPFDINDQVRGVLNVDATHKDAFNENDRKMLSNLAIQASKVIENTWLYEQIRFKAQMFESLTKVNEKIQNAYDLEEALEAVTREACQLMSARMCSVLMLDETGDWLELTASHGAGEAYRAKPRLHVEESFAGTVVRRCQPIQLRDTQGSHLYHNAELAREEGLVSMLSVPLMLESDPMGVLNVYTGKTHSFSDEEIHILKAFSNVSATAIQRARLNKDIRSMEEELRQREKLSALGLLAAEVAHEIRNPLTVMKMVYHALNLNFPEEDPRNEDVELLGKKMDQLNTIVERILDFARHNEPVTGPVNLNPLARNLYLLTRHKMKQHHIDFQMDLADQLPEIQADPGQIEQVLLNIALNSIDAMPSGGTLHLSTAHRKSGNGEHVVIAFRDTGLGMDERKMKQFDGLLQSNKPKGAGLGLMVVNKIVEAHAGIVKLISKPGQGTLIEIILPLVQPSDTQDPKG
ncbi:GAF domain-containing protein [Verrucomicrobia bacterium]|nr:GAF domain-containing protein [Verrucomicrobiota bacterium]